MQRQRFVCPKGEELSSGKSKEKTTFCFQGYGVWQDRKWNQIFKVVQIKTIEGSGVWLGIAVLAVKIKWFWTCCYF